MLRHSPESSTEPTLRVPPLLPMDAVTPSLWIAASKEYCAGGGPPDQPLATIVFAIWLK